MVQKPVQQYKKSLALEHEEKQQKSVIGARNTKVYIWGG